MKKTYLFLLPIVLLTVSACGSSGTVRPKARPIVVTLPQHTTANLLVAPPRLHVTASAVCRDGEGCTAYAVSFRNSGGNDLFLNYVPVTAEVDGQAMSWPEVVADPQRRPVGVSSVFLILGVEADDFRKMAEARSVTFNLGTTPLPLTYEQRAPFRDLIATVESNQPD